MTGDVYRFDGNDVETAAFFAVEHGPGSLEDDERADAARDERDEYAPAYLRRRNRRAFRRSLRRI